MCTETFGSITEHCRTLPYSSFHGQRSCHVAKGTLLSFSFRLISSLLYLIRMLKLILLQNWQKWAFGILQRSCRSLWVHIFENTGIKLGIINIVTITPILSSFHRAKFNVKQNVYFLLLAPPHTPMGFIQRYMPQQLGSIFILNIYIFILFILMPIFSHLGDPRGLTKYSTTNQLKTQ